MKNETEEEKKNNKMKCRKLREKIQFNKTEKF